MIVEYLTTPTASPVSLPDAKAHLRIDHSHEDARIADLIDAATEELQTRAQIALLSQTIQITLPEWPIDGLEFRLPIGPVMSGETATVTVDGTSYTDIELITGLRPWLRVGVAAEALTDAEREGRWVISYDAGWADEFGVPFELRHAIRDQVAFFYDFIGANGRGPAVSPAMARAIARYRGVKA